MSEKYARFFCQFILFHRVCKHIESHVMPRTFLCLSYLSLFVSTYSLYLMKMTLWQFQVKTLALNICKADEKNLLTDGEIPASIKPLLDKARGACERLLKEGMKLVKDGALQSTELGRVKEGHMKLSKHVSDISTLMTWHELPEKATLSRTNLERFVHDIAASVDTFNGDIESAKGRLKARKN